MDADNDRKAFCTEYKKGFANITVLKLADQISKCCITVRKRFWRIHDLYFPYEIH